jgi:hypothetical protein
LLELCFGAGIKNHFISVVNLDSLNPDPDLYPYPIRIQGLEDQKFKKKI